MMHGFFLLIKCSIKIAKIFTLMLTCFNKFIFKAKNGRTKELEKFDYKYQLKHLECSYN